MTEMRGISLWQPWASLWAIQAKKYETRSWATNYRGKIAVHAAKKPITQTVPMIPSDAWQAMYDALFPIYGVSDGHNEGIPHLPYGCVIATAELVECWKITNNGHTNGSSLAARIEGGRYGGKTNIIEGKEIFFGDWSPGRYAWEIKNVKLLPEPIPYKGAQGLWRIPDAEKVLKGA